MATARVTKGAVTREVTAFLGNTARARDLYLKIALHGYTGNSAATAVRLNNPDSRDAAQFIFFEIAAKFEDFAKAMFQVEVRSQFQITVARSVYVMGDCDNGINSKLGWGSPQRLKERGKNLFDEGSGAFFANLVQSVGNPTYRQLVSAHVVRNRVAHDGGAAQEKFVRHLAAEGIPAAERRGMSVGRYLRDYPTGSTAADRHFYRFLAAYEDFAQKAGAALP